MLLRKLFPLKRLLFIPLVSLLVFVLPGCFDRTDLEDVAFLMVLGIDLDQNNNLLMYDMVPVFNKKAKKKEDTAGVKPLSLRESRQRLSTIFAGVTNGRKLKIVLLGKRLLSHEDWFPILDVLYRDTKSAVTAEVVFVNGPLSPIINSHSPEKPNLSLYLYDLIDSSQVRSEAIVTTLHDLHRQMFEKGMTPAITHLQKEKDLVVKGTALLNEKGEYVYSLKIEENKYMMILKNEVKQDLSLSIQLPQMKKKDLGIFDNNVISFNIDNLKNKIKTAYRDDRFQFDFRISADIIISEREFPFDVSNNSDKLEKMIEEQLKMQFENLIKNIQKHKIDPLGLGLYARAHEYKEWQKVQDNWGEALSKADVKLNIKVKVKSMGPVK